MKVGIFDWEISRKAVQLLQNGSRRPTGILAVSSSNDFFVVYLFHNQPPGVRNAILAADLQSHHFGIETRNDVTGEDVPINLQSHHFGIETFKINLRR